MAYSFRHTKPKLTGIIRAEQVRCGKKNCRCVSGRLHGYYYYLYWRDDGVLKKEYVPRNEAHELQQQISISKVKDMKEKRLFKEKYAMFLQLLKGELSYE